MANNLTNEEREFHINVCAVDRNIAEVFTDDPIWLARMDKWYVAEKVIGQGKLYRVPTRQIVRVARLQRRPGAIDENDDEGADEGVSFAYCEAEDMEVA